MKGFKFNDYISRKERRGRRLFIYQRDDTDCTEGLEVYYWLSLKLNKRACFLTNRTNQGQGPGAMHLKSLMRKICLRSCLSSC